MKRYQYRIRCEETFKTGPDSIARKIKEEYYPEVSGIERVLFWDVASIWAACEYDAFKSRTGYSGDDLVVPKAFASYYHAHAVIMGLKLRHNTLESRQTTFINCEEVT